jgi:hypothetical protein
LSKKLSPKTEIVAYHKVKRKFMPLGEIQDVDPDLIQIYEFKDQNFNLIAG